MSSGALDFEGLSRSLLSRARELLPEWLPGGRIIGREYVCGNLRGEKGESLKVNISTGKWADFAADSKGGDLISLYAAVEGISQGDAAKRLADKIHFQIKPRQLAAPAPRQDTVSEQLSPPPMGEPVPSMRSSRLGDPTSYYTYRTASGATLFYVARYDTADQKKEFCPWSYSPTQKKFLPKGWPAPRPIYNLNRLAENPDRPVLIVEGEKAADAAEFFAGHKYVVVTWPNGAKSWNKADWTPVYGRSILIWPDADEAGVTASQGLASLLHPHVEGIKILDVEGQPDGWDAADAAATGWGWEEFVQWAKPRARVYSPPQEPEVIAADPEPEADAELVAAETIPTTNRVVTAAALEADMPNKSTRGTPLSTIENLKFILDQLGVTVRYNVISKEEEVLIPGQQFSIDNRANASLAWITSWVAHVRMPTGHIGEYLSYIADQNPYNPVAIWINSKAWDGKSRLEDLYATVKAKDELTDPEALVLKKTLIRRWLLSAVAAAFRPSGVSAHGVLVFQGEQYLGKTAWFKRLVPADLAVTADGMMLRPDDRDSVKQCVSWWLVELGELDATFRRSDIAQLKSFLTRDKDVLRRAYARKESEFARRTVFFASVNPKQFLHDNTGNRRYWTVECDAIWHDHTINMQQLWAEVYELYQAGEPWHLTQDEMLLLNTHNESFLSKDAIEERIATDLAWDAEATQWDWKTATQVLTDLGLERLTHGDVKKASQELFKRNGAQRKKSNGIQKLLVPPRLLKFGD